MKINDNFTVDHLEPDPDTVAGIPEASGGGLLAALEEATDNYSEAEREELHQRLQQLRDMPVNIMLIGATGCGKSSTINALFSCDRQIPADGATFPLVEIAKVGTHAEPETKDIEKYFIGNLTLWDTPGLGDSEERDQEHTDQISELLDESDADGTGKLIDLVLVILDGSSKDLGTAYRVLKDIVVPKIGDPCRILVALNQADIAMKTGQHWNYEKNEPDNTLLAYLEEKATSIQARILADCGLDITPVYYCAGYQETSGAKVYPYNLAKLLYCIVSSLPQEKRLTLIEGINNDADVFQHNDDRMNYESALEENFFEIIGDMFGEGIESGAEIGGKILGIPGKIIGGAIGGTIGILGSCVFGFLKGLDDLLSKT